MTALASIAHENRPFVVRDPRARRTDVESGAGSRVAHIAGMLAHELKNPLASAVTNISVAVEFCDESDPRRSFLDRALHDLDRVDALLRSCLDLACAERIHRRETRIADLLERFASDRIEVDAPKDIVVDVDPVLVERAVENVVENALRAGDGSLEIRIAASLSGDDLIVRIQDDGVGIPAEIRDRLFDPLVSASGGSGLGLAFVRRVCEAHAGEARVVDSSSRGACFELVFRATSDSV